MNFKQLFYTLNSIQYIIHYLQYSSSAKGYITELYQMALQKNRPTRGQSKMFNLIVCKRGAFMKSLFIENLFKRRYVVG